MRPHPPALDRQETLRYLGAGGTVDPALQALLDWAEQELLQQSVIRVAARQLPLNQLEPLLQGQDIKVHLKGCTRGLLLAVTLGAGLDAALRRALAVEPVYGVVLDAAASAYVEQAAQEWEQELRSQVAGQGLYMTGRFSPGYGDWPLTVQPSFLQWMDASRQAGLSTSESCMLVPGKSVTALCGIADHPVQGQLAGCAHCALSETCTKRKEGNPCV